MWDLDIQAWRSDGYERDHVKKKKNNRLQFFEL